MDIDVTKKGQTALLTVNGNVDEQGAELLKQTFYKLNMKELTNVVIDFKNVNHIGSAGIGKLLLFYKDFAISGGGITLENVSRSLFDLFKVVKLDTLMKINAL
ncbi:MAG: STAS domain-containing protein [Candidatus Magnetomorum sp.]|nr:STAS domain-containing protein [Candidatus Magnetomorum sp.]